MMGFKWKKEDEVLVTGTGARVGGLGVVGRKEGRREGSITDEDEI